MKQVIMNSILNAKPDGCNDFKKAFKMILTLKNLRKSNQKLSALK